MDQRPFPLQVVKPVPTQEPGALRIEFNKNRQANSMLSNKIRIYKNKNNYKIQMKLTVVYVLQVELTVIFR